MSDVARTQIADAIERIVREYTEGEPGRTGSSRRCSRSSVQIYPVSYELDDVNEGCRREALVEDLRKDVVDAYDEREDDLGDELMRALERFMLLQIIDERWREHLHDMDLREGIAAHEFAQIDPLVAYKNEGFEMLRLMDSIWDEFARYVFNVEIEVQEPQQRARPSHWWPELGLRRQQLADRSSHYLEGHSAAGRDAIAAAAGTAVGGRLGGRGAGRRRGQRVDPDQWRRAGSTKHEKIGRNDPCWCGSGKKFEGRHGLRDASGLRDQLTARGLP